MILELLLTICRFIKLKRLENENMYSIKVEIYCVYVYFVERLHNGLCLLTLSCH